MPYKICPNCRLENGPRKLKCDCGFEFATAKTRKKNKAEEKIIDWTTLKPGDKINVVSGYGPYRMKAGKRISFGEHGEFRVLSLSEDGILGFKQTFTAKGKGGKFGETRFIYMGNDYISKTGTNMTAHKIFLINNIRGE